MTRWNTEPTKGAVVAKPMALKTRIRVLIVEAGLPPEHEWAREHVNQFIHFVERKVRGINPNPYDAGVLQIAREYLAKIYDGCGVPPPTDAELVTERRQNELENFVEENPEAGQ